jgi:hypothetical protein
MNSQQIDNASTRGRMLFLALSIVGLLIAVWLAGCAGGGSSPLNSSGVPVVSTVGNNGQNTAAPPVSTCAGQGYPGTYPDCVCPQSWQTYTGATQTAAGTCTGTPPPTCPAGQSLTGYGAQCCPTGDTGNGTACAAPPPATCPSTTYGTPPNCLPIPSCSAVVGGYWGGPAAGCVCPATDTGAYPQCLPVACPAADYGTPPNCTPIPACPAGEYWGGPAVGCLADPVPTCAAPLIPINGACVPPPTLTVLMQLDPQTVVDSSAGTTPATESVLSWSVTSTLAGDNSFCTDANGNTVSSPTSVGPYPAAQDGAVTITIACEDIHDVKQSASIVLTVVPPPAAPADQFACTLNTDASVTCTWVAYEPAAECYVQQLSNGNVLSGQSGGDTGNVTSTTLFQPDQFQLYCNTGTTASPNPISVTP